MSSKFTIRFSYATLDTTEYDSGADMHNRTNEEMNHIDGVDQAESIELETEHKF